MSTSASTKKPAAAAPKAPPPAVITNPDDPGYVVPPGSEFMFQDRDEQIPRDASLKFREASFVGTYDGTYDDLFSDEGVQLTLGNRLLTPIRYQADDIHEDTEAGHHDLVRSIEGTLASNFPGLLGVTAHTVPASHGRAYLDGQAHVSTAVFSGEGGVHDKMAFEMERTPIGETPLRILTSHPGVTPDNMRKLATHVSDNRHVIVKTGPVASPVISVFNRAVRRAAEGSNDDARLRTADGALLGAIAMTGAEHGDQEVQMESSLYADMEKEALDTYRDIIPFGDVTSRKFGFTIRSLAPRDQVEAALAASGKDFSHPLGIRIEPRVTYLKINGDGRERFLARITPTTGGSEQ